MQYRLSHRQRKELDRGAELQIALPHPRCDVPDLLAWARGVLDVRPATEIRRAEILVLCVDPLAGPASGLRGVLGRLVQEGQSDSGLTLEVECIVCTLRRGAEPRSKYPTQWPGSVVLADGRTLPPPAAEHRP